VLQISGSADLFEHYVSVRRARASVVARLVDIGHTVVIRVRSFE
jgi:hypothetical protein